MIVYNLNSKFGDFNQSISCNFIHFRNIKTINSYFIKIKVSNECYDDMGRIMLHKYMVYVLAKYEFCR